MRVVLRSLLAACALLSAATAIAADAPLGEDRARRLLTRAGFAPSAAEVARFAPLTQPEAVDRMLAEVVQVASTPAPPWVDERILLVREYRTMSADEQRADLRNRVRMGLELKGWWLREMSSTRSPLTERMTLFWHSHFVSAQPKVRWAQLMYRQNALLRRHALGRFDLLLHEIARDPAMLVYLDTALNRRGAPNENFAREVMELFTLGEGRYAEVDVKEAARAFTGWSFDPETSRFLFRRLAHDGGQKTVLGRTGAFDGDAVLDILLAQPSTAEFIVNKLWREFVSPLPDPSRVRPIAAQFRSSGWRIDVAVRALLLQPELVQRSEDNALVKSPVELVVGLLRQSGGELVAPVAAAVALAGMGQNLFAPPNVRGWPGGNAWINTTTLLARKQFIERTLTSPASQREPHVPMAQPVAENDVEAFQRRLRALEQMRSVRVDPERWLNSAGLAPEKPLPPPDWARLEAAVLALPPSAQSADGALALDVLRAALLDSVYQLK
jgi:uncharacterized protein (DUF1800 family)